MIISGHWPACPRVGDLPYVAFVFGLFSAGAQRAIPAVSACNTHASIQLCVFGVDHAS
jgi:hypothetical protein